MIVAFTNLLPFNGDFSFGKSRKSQGAKSGLQGVWQTWVMWCFARKACTRAVEWAGASSWWSWSARPVESYFELSLWRNSFWVQIWCATGVNTLYRSWLMECLLHFSVLQQAIATYHKEVRHITSRALFLKQSLLVVSHLNMSVVSQDPHFGCLWLGSHAYFLCYDYVLCRHCV
jgi:hypothetical protein